jgi:YidC/Oxa1 family membrane protein insertase
VGSIWAQFKDIIFQLLVAIEGVVGDWGLAIIVLTVMVRLLLMPLTIKQTKSMYEMQRIQPKIKELQKKYKDDKEKLQEETLKFYQENKVNPFGGCLPLLLQMPLLIALYQVLGGTAKKPGLLLAYLSESGTVGRFLFLIPDIAKTPSGVFSAARVDGGVFYAAMVALPYIILVLLFALSIWLPQALMPGEKQQKMIGAYMAVVMLFFGWSAPAGVLLYWDVSSIWGVAQQQITTAMMKRKHPEAGVLEIKDAQIVDKGEPTKSGKGKKSKG